MHQSLYHWLIGFIQTEYSGGSHLNLFLFLMLNAVAFQALRGKLVSLRIWVYWGFEIILFFFGFNFHTSPVSVFLVDAALYSSNGFSLWTSGLVSFSVTYSFHGFFWPILLYYYVTYMNNCPILLLLSLSCLGGNSQVEWQKQPALQKLQHCTQLH